MMNSNTIVFRTSRRAFIQKVAGGAVAIAISGAVVGGGLPGPASAQSEGVSAAATEHYRTTAALNLRSQASTSSAVILVIPKGGLVAAAGPEQNSFFKVSYAGNIGWAHKDFLAVSNGGSNDTPVYTGNGYTSTDVHMRSGAGTSFSVLRVLPAGTTIKLYDNYTNNFRLISYADQYGWVSIDYIKPGGSSQQPGYLTTTAMLNLRSGPSIGNAVLKVIPANTRWHAVTNWPTASEPSPMRECPAGPARPT